MRWEELETVGPCVVEALRALPPTADEMPSYEERDERPETALDCDGVRVPELLEPPPPPGLPPAAPLRPFEEEVET